MEYVTAQEAKVFRIGIRNYRSNSREFLTPADVRAVWCSVFLITNVPHVDHIERTIDGYGKRPLDPRDVFHDPQPEWGDRMNFFHTMPGGDESPFQEIGRLYLVRYEIEPRHGETQVFTFRVECY